VDNSSVLLPPNYNKYELPSAGFWKKGNEHHAEIFWIGVALFIRRVVDVDTKNEVPILLESTISKSRMKGVHEFMQ